MASEDDFFRQLRLTFLEEAGEHLESMRSGLLEYERESAAASGMEPQILKTVYRAAHSLKGAARAVDMRDAEALCQSLETVFQAAQSGTLVLDCDAMDALHAALGVLDLCLGDPDQSQDSSVQSALERLHSCLSSSHSAEVCIDRTEETESLPVPESAASAGLPSQADQDGLSPGAEPASVAPVSAPAAYSSSSGHRDHEPPASSPPVSGTFEAPGRNPVPLTIPPIERRKSVSPTPAAEAVPGHTPEPRADVVDRASKDVTTPGILTAGSGHHATRNPAAASEDKKIRIKAERLDVILSQAEEMLSIKLNLARQSTEAAEVLAAVDAFSGLWKQAQRSLASASTVLAATKAPEARQLDQLINEGSETLLRLSSHVQNLWASSVDDERNAGVLVDDLIAESRLLLMMPFSSIAALFPRMVRDLARSLDKEASLEIEGGEIELEKGILEKLQDPLMHMIRNAVDHGIESPQQRKDAGKPERGSLRLALSRIDSSHVQIRLSDDGRGIDLSALQREAVRRGLMDTTEAAILDREASARLMFLPGLSTSESVTEVSGRGLGMAIVRDAMEALGGDVRMETEAGRGSSFVISIPATRATFRGLRIAVAGSGFILPTTGIDRVLRVKPSELFRIDTREAFSLEGVPCGIAHLADILALPRLPESLPPPFLHLVVLGFRGQRVALIVDEILEELEVLVKPFGARLAHIAGVLGISVLGSGESLPVLDLRSLFSGAAKTKSVFAGDLEAILAGFGTSGLSSRQAQGGVVPGIRESGSSGTRQTTAEDAGGTSAAREKPVGTDDDASSVSRGSQATGHTARGDDRHADQRQTAVLVVEDSVTSRLLLRSILESAGFKVATAVDGVEGFAALRDGDFDLVVSDVEMPRLDGFGLTQLIRADGVLASIPVILVTSLDSPEHRERGAKAGADAYIVKSGFDQSVLIQTIRELAV